MLSLISVSKAQLNLAENVRVRRLAMNLTQEGLAVRTGVPVATIRRFEQKGAISLESFLKILKVIGGIEEMIEVLKPSKPRYTSIDDVLREPSVVMKKRGRKK